MSAKFRRATTLLSLILTASLMMALSNPSQKNLSPEYQVKAVFLYNFTKFIEWPPVYFDQADSPFIIGILGEDPFGKFIDETVKGEKIREHPLEIKRFSSVDQIQTCHILFVGNISGSKLEKILTQLKGKKILSVGDSQDFNEQGGIINFYTEENKIKLRVNLHVANEEDILISSKLLRVATIYDPKK